MVASYSIFTILKISQYVFLTWILTEFRGLKPHLSREINVFRFIFIDLLYEYFRAGLEVKLCFYSQRELLCGIRDTFAVVLTFNLCGLR